jgi:hypothetical protein
MKEFLKSGYVGNIYPDKKICIHTYAQAKKSGKLDEKIKQIADRWAQFGFTEGFPEERKEELAYAYEQLAIFLIFCEDDQTDRLFKKDGSFETVGFPLTRKVLSCLEPNEFDFQKFIKYCKIFNSNDFIELVDKLNPLTHDDPNHPWHRKYANVDLEAEAVYYVSEMIIEKFKNPDEDDEVIKKKYTDKLYEIINKKKEELENERTSSDNTDA